MKTFKEGDKVVVKGMGKHSKGSFIGTFKSTPIIGEAKEFGRYYCDFNKGEHVAPMESFRHPVKHRVGKASAAIALALLALTSGVAKADERAALANALAVEQAVDIATSQSIFRHGGYERNPLAPKSLAGELAVGVGFQLLARNPHVSLRLLRGTVIVYPIIGVNNLRVLFRVTR